MPAHWAAALLGVVAAMIASWALAPIVAVPPAAGAVVAFVCACASVLVVARTVPSFRLRALAWIVVPAVALGAVAWLGPRARGIGWAALAVGSLLAGGTLIGSVIGRRIQHPSHLLVAAWVSSLADVFSVLAPHGPTAQVVANERLLSVVALSWPVLGTRDVVPLLGAGDVVMCAMYLVASRELGLSVRRTTGALAAGLAAVLLALLILPIPLPALPFLGVAVVLAQPRTRRFRKGEGRTAVVGLALLTALFAVLFWL